MTFMTLTATPQARAGNGNVPLNLTTMLAAGALGSNSGVEWVNGNREVLYIQQGTAKSDFTLSVGTTIEGQSVQSITYTGVANDIQFIGPFDSLFDVNPGDFIQVTFATPANVTGVALVSNSGAV
jgi:hypothetical protein